MAYTRLSDPKCPLPVEPMVLSVYLPNAATAYDVPIYVPWEDVTLTYARTAVVTAIDATGAMEIDLEVDAAGGTEIGSITVAASAAAGVMDEDTTITRTRFSYNESSIDSVNVEVDGSAAAAGAVMLYLYFEKYR